MQDYYGIVCPYCTKQLFCAPSVLDRLGFNDLGHGHCPDCGNLFEIVYNEKEDRMETRRNEKVSN